MFKFVNNDANNPTGKRKQSQRACEVCRRRKKRCIHNEPGQESLNGDSSLLQPSSPLDGTQETSADEYITPRTSAFHESPGTWVTGPPTATGLTNPRSSTADMPESNVDSEPDASSSLNSRFIGDLNPEGIFLAATSPGATRGATSNDGVGVWLAKALNGRTSELPTLSQSSLFHGSTSLLPKVLVPALEQETLSMLPPSTNATALSNIYFEKMHPIIPLIDQNGFQSLPPADARCILLQQGICLAASKLFISRQHLILPRSDLPLTHREFGTKLWAAMRLILELGLVADKIVRIQAFGLMAHFADGPDAADLASQVLSRSVQHLISLGLHIPGRHQSPQPYGITLFCCVWALDRMNAAFHGRPVMMHERDIAQDMEQCIGQQQLTFRLLMEVILLLDKVISLYRWSYDQDKSGIDIEFLSFEEMVSKSTIETLYHAVAMLSYRSKTWESPNGPQRSSIAYLRQSLASSRVSSTAGREVRDQLVLLPFVPYAFSLSMSVAYREMRHNKIPMSRGRARAQFQSNCDILSELGDIFLSASTMAEMGKSTLKEMDRVFSAVAVSEQRKSRPDSRNGEIINVGLSSRQNASEVPGSYDPTSVNSPQSVPQVMPDFDPSLFDSISDMDLFGMFDPTFDLTTVDACFGGNLDLSFPSKLQ